MILYKYNGIKVLKILFISILITIKLNELYLRSASHLSKKNMITKIEESYLKIFILTHKDFINHRYNSVYNIVADDKMQLNRTYNLNVIYASDGILYNKKRGYCEMEKIYYIYQLYLKDNISSKYIGFNHYRRYFNFTDNIPDLDEIFKSYDIILTAPINTTLGMKLQYCRFHICKLYDEILDIIKEIKPEYYKTAIETSEQNIVYICNLFIMKKKDFLKYCKFMFDILFEFDKRHNFKNDNDILNFTNKIYNNTYYAKLQARLEGYLSERISNIFFFHNFKRIKSFKMLFENNMKKY